MSDIKQITTFEKTGLDSDSSNLWMENGRSPFFLNIMLGEDGLQGVLTNMKGNILKIYDQPLTLSRAYKTVGSYYNNLTRKCYYFIFSQPYLDPITDTYLHDNRLICYNEDIQTFDTIFNDTHNYFELDPVQHLTDIKMIKTWLFFNPVTAQPKMIDVDMAYNYTNYLAYDDTNTSFAAVVGDIYTFRGGLFVANDAITAGQSPSTDPTVWDRIGDSYQDESTLGETEFNRAFFAIKIPPKDRIELSYGTDTTINSNSLRGKIFRFCHRYQYFDNSYSVCSAHSVLTLPDNDELYNGEKVGDITFNNYIKLEFSLYSSALVKNIEIFFQEIGGDWRRMTIINRQDQSLLDEVNHTFNFYNNDTYPIIAQVIPDIIQDALPKLASSQEIINKNVLCFAGCTEGFDNIDKDLIDVVLTPEIEEFNMPQTITSTRIDLMTGGYIVSSEVNGLYKRIIKIGTWFTTEGDGGIVAGDVFDMTFGRYKAHFILTSGNLLTANTLAQAIVDELRKTSGYDYLGVNRREDNQIEILKWGLYPPAITVCQFVHTSSNVDALFKIGGFKTAAYHPFCLFYYDEVLRRGDAQISDDMKVYVPSINEYSPSLISGTNYKWSIDWVVKHEPPAWAKYWRWGYAGNRRSSSFVQYIVKDVDYSTPAAVSYPEDVSNTVKIDLTPLQEIRTTTETDWNCFPNSIIPLYEFKKGDRIRFITQSTNPTITGTVLGDAIDGIYDFEILKFDPVTESTNQVTGVVSSQGANMAYVQTFNFAGAGIGVNSLVEIYTPIKDIDFSDKTQTLTYYEFGDLMPIIEDSDGNLVHGGKTQDQELSPSPSWATGTFSKGDIYHILRTPSKPLCTYSAAELTVGAYHESMWWSDFYPSADWDRGKLGLESPMGEIVLNIIRYSNVYLQNTHINGLTTFEALKYKELNDVFGRIISIVEVGDTLKCYQEKKPSSILVGRTEYQDDGSGNGNVVISSATLGAIRYSNTNYGTVFPESISKNNRYVYGFDIYNGVMWRDSANGIFPISGRYVDVGGSVDYKMQSYFKAKSKTILASGVDHCHVLTVWDEEFKMLFVCFKDTVDEANNETIGFHEPSDRWLPFTEFEYTPKDGWNDMLEPTYRIVKGFENGLGYSFDLESRFSIFDIGSGLGTPGNIRIDVRTVTPVITLPSPVVIGDAYMVPTANAVVATLPTASVLIMNPPVAIAATNLAPDSFTANWNASDDTLGYKVDVSTSIDFSNSVANFNDLDVGNVLSVYVGPVETHDVAYNYYYRVRAYNAVGTTISSNIITATTIAFLAIPLSNNASNITSNSFTANWNAVSADANGYYLDVAPNPEFTAYVSSYYNHGVGNVSSYPVTGLSANYTYYYRIRAHSTLLTSGNSAIISVTTLPSSVPAAPDAHNAAEVTQTTFRANWTYPVAGATGYRIDVAVNSFFGTFVFGHNYLDIGDVSNIVISGLTAGTTYYYRVYAYNGAGTGVHSNEITITTLA